MPSPAWFYHHPLIRPAIRALLLGGGGIGGEPLDFHVFLFVSFFVREMWSEGSTVVRASLSHRIHVWYIYLHLNLVNFYGRCRYICHTWILRVLVGKSLATRILNLNVSGILGGDCLTKSTFWEDFPYLVRLECVFSTQKIPRWLEDSQLSYYKTWTTPKVSWASKICFLQTWFLEQLPIGDDFDSVENEKNHHTNPHQTFQAPKMEES